MKKILAIIALLLSFGNVCSANRTHPFLLSFNSSDGITDPGATSGCQDVFGRVWMATRNGVFFTSGTRFFNFRNTEYNANCSKLTHVIAADTANNIWIATSTGTGFYNPLTNVFTNVPELANAQVHDIEIAPGVVWFVTEEGIWRYDNASTELKKAMMSATIHPKQSCLMEDGNIVFTTKEGFLYAIDADAETVRPIRFDITWSKNEMLGLENICFAEGSSVLVSTNEDEVVKLDTRTGSCERVLSTSSKGHIAKILSLMLFEEEYWICTSTGLIVYDPATGEIDDQSSGEKSSSTLNGEVVIGLFSDKGGNVWAGTLNNLRCYRNYHGKLGRYLCDESEGSLHGTSVRTLCYEPSSYVWTGSVEGVVNRLDTRTGRIEDLSASVGLKEGTTITSMKMIDGFLWITTFGDGIYVYDTKNLRSVRKIDIPEKRCMSLLKASNGDVFIGSSRGLYKQPSGTESIVFLEQAGENGVHSMDEDTSGRILIGTYGDGIGTLDLSDESYKPIPLDDLSGDLSIRYVNAIRYKDGNIWLATEDTGVVKVELSSSGDPRAVKSYSEANGYPMSATSGLLWDASGMMWILTVDGCVMFNPSTERVESVHFQSDKVVSGNFHEGASCITEDGQFYLGTRKGLLYFSPDELSTVFDNGNVMISNIILGTLNARRSIAQKGHSAMTSEVVRVKHKDASMLTFTYACSDFENPDRIEYECRMKKNFFNNELTVTEPQVSYFGLAPGKYDFSVKVSGSDNPDAIDHMSVVIMAPWYLSTVAKILYTLLLLAAVYFAAKSRIDRRDKEIRSMAELAETESRAQLLKEKMDFMTNITHEIRTPVSLISILVDKLSANNRIPQEDMADFISLKSSTNRLFELCNELLEFRKLKDGKMQLVMKNEDFCSVVGTAAESFKTLAEERNINYSVSIPDHPVTVSCDRNAVESIVTNLLSNAVKYCENYISLSLETIGDMIRLVVNSDGPLIPAEESEQIFDAFFQSKNINSSGYGLGLTFSRTLALRQGGSLFLDTKNRKLNSFVLTMPVVLTETLVPQDTTEDSAAEEKKAQSTVPELGRPQLLVVEDNVPLRNVIRDELSQNYDIIVASDGSEALDIIKKENIDLVVSDIMMPVMDGCEMCNAIKSNIDFSHILVILLTAATGVEMHIKSLKAGADSYIEKPFKMDVLKANIESLLRNREIRNEQFSKSPLSLLSYTTSSKVEMEFMSQLQETVLDNASDSEFSTSLIAEKMKVSRRTLSAKVKANTGLSVNEYVRLCRLKKAAELLSEKKYRINEVAYLVGYSSPSYFAQHFQAQFGVKPSEFVKGETKKES